MTSNRVVVGVTGGSGSILAVRFLENLTEVEKHLVISEHAEIVLREEAGVDKEYLNKLADYVYDDSDIAARISSGSFIFSSFVIIPCSISTLGKINSGISDTLITRVASVALKEHRRMILVPRETPLSTVALRNMAELSAMGVIIAPAMPGYYTHPKTADDMINFIVSRILDLVGVENNLIRRWRE
jgi:4-hydroxy-3-polyprenylbenzoate decarboxylase